MRPDKWINIEEESKAVQEVPKEKESHKARKVPKEKNWRHYSRNLDFWDNLDKIEPPVTFTEKEKKLDWEDPVDYK